MRHEMTHMEMEARDEQYMAAVRALPRYDGTPATQVRVATEYRRVLARFFPEMRWALNALPELEKV